MRSTLHLAFVAATLVASLSCAGSNVSHAAQPVAALRERPLFLWRVSSSGAPASYLFGTCHVGVTLQRALPDDQQNALDGARVVATEADVDARDAVMQAVARLMLPDDQSLRTMLGDAAWHLLVGQTPFATMPWIIVDRFHPFLVSTLLAVSLSNVNPPGVTPPDPMDVALVRSARAHGARVVALETLDQQADMILRIPIDTFVHEARETLESPDRVAAALNAIIDACANGDAAAVERTMSQRDSLSSALIAPRNAAWLPRVDALMREGGAFVAVGVGHLVGAGGLVAALSAPGFHIERLATRDVGAWQRASVDTASGPPSPSSSPPPPLPAPIDDPSGRPRAEWLAPFADAFAQRLCAMPMTAECLHLEAPACVALEARAVRFCDEQYASSLPAHISPGNAAAPGGRLGGCAAGAVETLGRLRGFWNSTARCNDPNSWATPPVSAASPAPAPTSAPPAPARPPTTRRRH